MPPAQEGTTAVAGAETAAAPTTTALENIEPGIAKSTKAKAVPKETAAPTKKPKRFTAPLKEKTLDGRKPPTEAAKSKGKTPVKAAKKGKEDAPPAEETAPKAGALAEKESSADTEYVTQQGKSSRPITILY